MPVLPSAAVGFFVFVAVVAGYAVARTPGDVLDGPIVTTNGAAPVGGQVTYVLETNKSARQIGDELQQLGVIRSGDQLQLLVALMGLESKLSAGEYVLDRGSSALTVIDSITVKLSSPTVKVTFPEGLRVEEMAEIAEQRGFGSRDQFLRAVAEATVPPELAGVIPENAGLQGYLFPDTYILPEGSTAAQLVALMLKTFVRRFTPELQAAAKARGLSVHQAVTLASIVEREAAVAEERPMIAAVFYNRLDASDLLGADPTVQFAVALSAASVEQFGWWKKELTVEDLRNSSAYNTRLVAGLPPGPITNPGLASLEAVAHPATTDAYYFVADARKADGSHVFAETLAEHERNIATVGAR
ncbi:MAG: endolytic transglycosylase MltG [Dehalococcoidia bacterium]